MLRVIREITPNYILGENVPGILRIAARDVVEDLEREGYNVAVFDYEAAAVGAPHRRERIAFVANRVGNLAHSNSTRLQGRDSTELSECASERTVRESCAYVSDTYGFGCKSQQYQFDIRERWLSSQQSGGTISDTDNRSGAVRRDRQLSAVEKNGRTGTDNRARAEEYVARQRRAVESRLGDGVNGLSGWMAECRRRWADGSWEYGIPRLAQKIPHRVDKLKCLGNAVVPAQFYPIFKAIYDIEVQNVIS